MKKECKAYSDKINPKKVSDIQHLNYTTFILKKWKNQESGSPC